MKKISVLIQFVLALLVSIGVIALRGIDFSKPTADVVLAIGDGFAIVGLIYLSFGALLWVSTTGFFDIFSYAFRKGAHAIVPKLTRDDDLIGFYEYKLSKNEKRSGKSIWSTLFVGALILTIAGVFTIIWYQMQ